MTLAQLRYFCTAARLHSITLAARALFVTQPTISIAVRDLEKELSITLFSHAGGQLTLTEEGERFYRRAADILSACEDLRAEYAGKSARKSKVLVGIPPILSSVFFPELMDDFHEEYPDVWLELMEFGSVRACDLVQNEMLDLALVNMEIHDVDKFNTMTLSQEPLYFCCWKGHPLENKDRITLQELHDQPVILYNQDSVQTRLLQARFEALQIYPLVIMRSSQLPTIVKFLRQGRSGAFLYKSVLDLGLVPELIGIPLDPPMTSRVGLVWKKGRYLGSGAQAFLDFCRRKG